MPTSVRSYAKINLGLHIGAEREDGFHELRTVYQTIALHDVIRVQAGRGMGIEIRCKNPKVPQDETNTCWRVTERVLKILKKRAKVTIAITKNLPVQGGLGAGSSNGVATMLALEKELGEQLTPAQKLEIAASDRIGLAAVPGGRNDPGNRPRRTGLSARRPVGDFDVWSQHHRLRSRRQKRSRTGTRSSRTAVASPDKKLTANSASGTINGFSTSVFAWLMSTTAGVPAKSGDRAETPLLDLVRAGIENDFERVVFPQYPELRDVKRVLEREGAKYASLSGSGSSVYGLFVSAEAAEKAAAKLQAKGIPAEATRTVSRAEYWRDIWIG